MTEPKELAVVGGFSQLATIKKQLSDAQIAYIKTIFPTLTPNELLLTVYKAQNLGLDVLNGEVTAYATTNFKGVRQLVFIAGKDAKARKANSTKKVEYAYKEAIYVKTVDGVQSKAEPWEGGTLWGAKASVKRTDQTEPHTITVKFDEYKQDNKQWKDKPDTMIQKVALSQAYTEAFPELFSGVYEEAEMPKNPENINAEEGEVVNVEEPVLDGESIEKINSAKTKEELLAVCKKIKEEKGEKYRNEILKAYTTRSETIEAEAKEVAKPTVEEPKTETEEKKEDQ